MTVTNSCNHSELKFELKFALCLSDASMSNTFSMTYVHLDVGDSSLVQTFTGLKGMNKG